MDIKKLNSRNAALDIIRIVAVFTVVSVHFFLNNGFYSQPVEGTPMLIACIMRTLFTVCVPLFMILTGYLMCKKTVSKKYYSGIVKTLLIFVIATFACMMYKHIANNEALDLKSFILGTLNFSGATYSWYIEMYIGLFLIAPFLNLAYNKLSSQKQKQVLVGTFVAITILPSLLNMFSFESAEWWLNPTSSDSFTKLFPNWWIGFYPVAYYFTGCYIREYGFKIKTSTLSIIFALSVFVFGVFNYFRSYGTTFKSGIYIYWYGFESYLLAVFLFILLSRIKTDKMSTTAKYVLWKVSDLALGVYLISYIFDRIVYNVLNTNVPLMPDRLPYYFVTVPIVFVCSILASALMNLIAKGLIILFNYVVAFIKKQCARDDKDKWQVYTFVVLMAGSIIFAFWKCVYGFGGNDEAFYLTVPHRLTLGDAFIADEWHLSQLSGFLTMPFVWLYTTIMQSTDGILLAARILYIIFHTVITCIIYSRLRKHGYIAVFGCVLYFLFTPFDIMAMSYNTMGLDLVAVTGTVMGTISYKKKLPIILSGIAFAAAVLCCPYLVIAYIMFALGVAAHILIKKTKFNKNVFNTQLFAGKTFLWFSVGVFALAAVFIIFALTRASIGDILTNLPHLLKDPEHPQMSIFTKLNFYFKTIWDCQSHFKYCLICYGIMLVIMIIDKKRKLHRSLYLIASASAVIISLVMFMPSMIRTHYNAIMFPMIFIGITSYILTEKKQRTLMASLFALGIIYSFALCFSSNQYFYVTAMAVCASNIAGYVFLSTLLKEMRETEDNLDYPKLCKYTGFIMVAFMIFLQGAFQITVKANHCFWDGNTDSLTTKITAGPAKGIITTYDNCQKYTDIYNDLKYYDNLEQEKILCLTARTWTYLALNDYPYGTLSAWITGENQTSINRLYEYYKVNPENRPRYIYIPKASTWDFSNVYTISNQMGYKLSENDVSYKLYRIN